MLIFDILQTELEGHRGLTTNLEALLVSPYLRAFLSMNETCRKYGHLATKLFNIFTTSYVERLMFCCDIFLKILIVPS